MDNFTDDNHNLSFVEEQRPSTDYLLRSERVKREVIQGLWRLQDLVGVVNSNNGWHDRMFRLLESGDEDAIRDHTMALLALITSEVAEAMEDIRNDKMSSEFEGTKPVGFPSELADVVIRVFDLSYMLGIDLSTEIVKKIEYNSTRGIRHGGKKL